MQYLVLMLHIDLSCVVLLLHLNCVHTLEGLSMVLMFMLGKDGSVWVEGIDLYKLILKNSVCTLYWNPCKSVSKDTLISKYDHFLRTAPLCFH